MKGLNSGIFRIFELSERIFDLSYYIIDTQPETISLELDIENLILTLTWGLSRQANLEVWLAQLVGNVNFGNVLHEFQPENLQVNKDHPCIFDSQGIGQKLEGIESRISFGNPLISIMIWPISYGSR